uniref:F5/8 type C domain-containing protein n=1 Tax=Branchiostoma floridae TaxID=7739 RepID=C3ZH67_BRAFL|eukprot:XP_002592203.1 hypothetical protein BRAFLDRAFT_84629 [Branchiostoma floridae]
MRQRARRQSIGGRQRRPFSVVILLVSAWALYLIPKYLAGDLFLDGSKGTEGIPTKARSTSSPESTASRRGMGDLLRRRGNGQKDGKGISNSPVKRPHTEQLAPITVGPSTPSHNVRFKKVMVKKTPNVTLLKIRKSLNKSGTQKGADAIDHYFTFSVSDKDALEDKLRPTADEATFTSDGTFQTISNGDQERSQPVGTKTQEIGQTHSDRFFSHYNHTEHGVRSQPETMFDAVEEKTPKMNHRGKDEVPVPYSIEDIRHSNNSRIEGNATNPKPAPRAQYKPRRTRKVAGEEMAETPGHWVTENGPESGPEAKEYTGSAYFKEEMEHEVNEILLRSRPYWKPLGTTRYHNNWFVVLDYHVSYTMKKLRIANYGCDWNHDVKAFTLQVSNTRNPYYDWTPVLTVTDVAANTSLPQYFGGFSASGRYWRVTVTATYSGWEPWMRTFQLFGIKGGRWYDGRDSTENVE